jgi:propionaldehyde dehydrogenase
MPQADEIRRIVEEVLKSPEISGALAGLAPAGAPAASAAALGCGVFADVDSAVRAAAAAQRELIALPLDARRRLIDAMRHAVIANNESLSREAVSETGLGNVRDKQVKNTLAVEKTPGVEDVEPSASSDEHGLTITERAPLAVDGVQAGVGDLVLVVDEGGSAREVIADESAMTVRTTICGIVDRVNIEIEESVLDARNRAP